MRSGYLIMYTQWVFIIGVVLYALGMGVYVGTPRFSGIRACTSSVLIGMALMFVVWGCGAASSRSIVKTEIVGDIVEKKLPDGTVADIVIYEDETGKHEVNINTELGIKIPHSALNKKMRLTRLNYEALSWGLRFETPTRYEISQDK